MTHYAGPGPWGPGEGQLSTRKFDDNNYDFATRIDALETSPPQPNDIVAITLTGSFLSMTQRDGTILGPVPFSPPMARWRSEWAVETEYVAFDFVTVTGVGLYGVLRDHTSDDTEFDENAVNIDGDLLYRKVVGFSGTTAMLSDLIDVRALSPSDGDQLVYDNSDPDNPVWITQSLTATLDDGIGSTQGSIAYRNATEWVPLAPGTSGDVLTTGGAAANPAWATPSAGTPGGVGGDIQTNNGGGGFGSIAPASGVATFLSTPTSANLRAALTDEVGTGAAYFVGGALGTPASGTATNLTGLPVAGIASISNLRIVANVSGGAASPSANTMTAILDAVFGSTRGEIISRGASVWGAVSPGKSGYTLQLNSSLDPVWVQVAAGGKGGSTGTAPSNWLLGADYATDGALAANTYSNGSSGVGATLTGNANGALSVDGSTPIVADRILVKDEVSGAHNGVYAVTTVGSGGAAYVLTRASDYDQTTEIVQGSAVAVAGGTANAGTAWVLSTSSSITIGSTSLDYDSLTAQLPDLAAGYVLGNSNSFTAPAAPTSLSAIIDRAIASTRGAVLYRGASGWAALSPGTSGDVLTTAGAGGDPSWSTAGSGSGLGDVSGGSTSADGELAAYNGTAGKTLKQSFAKFSGPASSVKTYTLPNASSTILTDNAAVTVAQGGTGQTSYTDGQLLIGNTSGNTLTKATLTAGSNITITNGNGSISIASTASASPAGSTNDIQTNAGSGSFGAITPASGIATFLATPSSANLRAALTDEVGTGAAYFVGGALGTPASGTATNLTSIPVAQATGVLPAANGGAGTVNGVLKANGSGTVSAASAGTDYVAPTGAGLVLNLLLPITGTMSSGELLVPGTIIPACSFPSGAAGSYGSSAVAATGSATITAKKNGSAFATFAWSASGTTATVTISGTTSFNGTTDKLSIEAPASADATLADVGLNLAGTRS